MKKQRGFTLIELLVVMAIVAVLSTLALVAISGTQRQARDTVRRNDLKEYSIALENYYTTNNAYPAVAYGIANTGLSATLSANYMGGTMLADKKTTASCAFDVATNFNYCYYGTATDYILTTKLESGTCFQVCGMANSTLSGGKSGNVTCAATHQTCIVP